MTVFWILSDGPGYSEEYKSVRNREFINVDFPKPDSPESTQRKKNDVGWIVMMRVSVKKERL